jgi:hypothetical protein
VQTEELGNNSTRLHIFFSVLARGVDYQFLPIGGPHPMVPVVVAGDATFYWVTKERTSVERCLDVLQSVGCFMPDYSYFKIKQLETCELLRGFARLIKMWYIIYVFFILN